MRKRILFQRLPVLTGRFKEVGIHLCPHNRAKTSCCRSGIVLLFMAALCNTTANSSVSAAREKVDTSVGLIQNCMNMKTTTHIIFLPCGFFFYLSIFFLSSPNLSGHRFDVYRTSTHGVALVRI